MKDLSTREKVLLGILAGAIVLFIYFKYLFSPMLDNIIAVRSNIKQYKEDINTIGLTKKLNEKQNDELKQLREKFTEAAVALPPMERNPEIVYNFRPLADKNGIVLNSISFGEPFEFTQAAQNGQGTQNNGQNQNNNSSSNANKPAVEKLFAVPVNLSVSGEYMNIINFITSVEKDKRIAEIGDVSISGGSTGKLQASISMNYFYADTENKGDTRYEFNKGSYGKTDPFKP